MNIVDSSGWLEFFGDGPNADFFAPTIENVPELVVPSLSLYEVFKRVLQQRGEDAALQAVGVMAQGRVVDLSMPLVLNAAKISVDLRLPMADSIMLAKARAYHATLWTQDADFRGIEGVQCCKAYMTEQPNQALHQTLYSAGEPVRLASRSTLLSRMTLVQSTPKGGVLCHVNGLLQSANPRPYSCPRRCWTSWASLTEMRSSCPSSTVPFCYNHSMRPTGVSNWRQ